MSSDTLDDEYEEYDEIEVDEDEEEEDEGLSGLVVLLMGVVMLGAIVSVVGIAYQHGVHIGEARNGQPYVTADPEPIKIENNVLTADASDNLDREVYDQFDGAPSEPVETIAAGPEEPLDRPPPGEGGSVPGATNPLTAAAPEQVAEAIENADDAVADRIAALAAADAEFRQSNGDDGNSGQTDTPAVRSAVTAPTPASVPSRKPATRESTTRSPSPAARSGNTSSPAPRPTTPAVATPTVSAPASSGSAGTHVVQVAALSSREEADAAWSALGRKMGDYLDGKRPDILAPTSVDDIYFRLRIAPFSSADAARTYCAGLKERGGDCLVRAR